MCLSLGCRILTADGRGLSPSPSLGRHVLVMPWRPQGGNSLRLLRESELHRLDNLHDFVRELWQIEQMIVFGHDRNGEFVVLLWHQYSTFIVLRCPTYGKVQHTMHLRDGWVNRRI